jgi:MFS superfamily sulfate permease-like transporter
MTGVIVRSSANVQAGAVTRLSAILHAVWILALVAMMPWLLRTIPMAALGAVLVVTGWKLVSVSHLRHLFHHYGVLPSAIWAVTFVLVVATDLLTGVLVGLGLSLLELVPHFRRLRLKVDTEHGEEAFRIRLDGAATFLGLPRLNRVLDAAPADRPVRLDLDAVPAIDHSCAEMLRDWVQRRRARGAKVELSGDPRQLRKLHAATA